jgi:hypothetical protein
MIESDRFILKELTPIDVTDRYVRWMEDAVSAGFVLYSGKTDISI